MGKCKECNGSGQVVLFMYPSPCHVCNSHAGNMIEVNKCLLDWLMQKRSTNVIMPSHISPDGNSVYWQTQGFEAYHDSSCPDGTVGGYYCITPENAVPLTEETCANYHQLRKVCVD